MAIVFSRPLQFLLTSASNPFANHLETIRLIHLLQSLISERSSRYFVLSDPIVSTFSAFFHFECKSINERKTSQKQPPELFCKKWYP